MSWEPCKHGAHDWKPIQGWPGRYRCRVCSVIGYCKTATVRDEGRKRHSVAIKPYVCKKCGGPATKRLAKGRPICRACAEG